MHPTALDDRLAFISGAASGIGYGIAEALAVHRMRIAIADIDAPAAEAAAARLREAGAEAMALALDVRALDAWNIALDSAEQKFGPLAVLASNAGVAGSRMPVAQTDPIAWDWTIAVNLNGAFNAARAALPRLLQHGQPGHFMATASLGGFLVQPGNAAYSAAKAGVIALCEALRAELAGSAIGVSVLCPGLVSTRLLEANASRMPGIKLSEPEPELEAMLRAGMPPREAGELVVKGIIEDRFWLFTHPELGPHVEARAAEIRAAGATR